MVQRFRHRRVEPGLHADGYDLSIFQISSIEERREFFDMLPVRRNADAVIVASIDVDAQEAHSWPAPAYQLSASTV